MILACCFCGEAWRALRTVALLSVRREHPTVLLLILLICLSSQTADAAPPQTHYLQRLDAQLPLTASFTDDSGRIVRLGDFFDKRPVVLVFGYYHCRDLCSTVMDGVLESLASVKLPRGAYRVVGVSIDPTEDAGLAARKKASYAALLAHGGGDLHLLTGGRQHIDALAHSAGFQYAYDASTREYVHPAGFLIATPDGRISRYFMGVRFDPRDVRLALVDASSGRIGSPADRLLLLCSHYDPVTGRYTVAVMTVVRLVCIAIVIALASWLWRARRGRAA